jgi:ribosomal-protein-serine acetyltransferase
MPKIEKPILLDLPVPIRTKRLLIRPIMPGDGKIMNEAVLESFDQFKEWLPWAKEMPPNAEESEITAREMYADFILRKQMPCVVFSGSELIGMCGFVTFNWHIPSAEIGYWCRKTAQGKSFIPEAVNALTFYGFQQIKLQKIIIRCDEENLASIKVAEKCGYKLESTSYAEITKPITGELRTCRKYVRFNLDGIDKNCISW